ncbi:hypothetical protein C8J56DRAFT_891983 [Mycena floridula]|nr:hypothetical protein C8J56DRAFT_891983 [Mycena floridula]
MSTTVLCYHRGKETGPETLSRAFPPAAVTKQVVAWGQQRGTTLAFCQPLDVPRHTRKASMPNPPEQRDPSSFLPVAVEEVASRPERKLTRFSTFVEVNYCLKPKGWHAVAAEIVLRPLTSLHRRPIWQVTRRWQGEIAP